MIVTSVNNANYDLRLAVQIRKQGNLFKLLSPVPLSLILI
jgi:hypothetical protein